MADIVEGQAPIVIQQPPEIVEVPAAPTVSETLGAAAAVVDLAGQLQAQNTPGYKFDEMTAAINRLSDKLDVLITAQAINPPTVIIEPPPEPEAPPVVNEPEVIVNTGTLEKEEIKTPLEEASEQKPKPRARRWI